MPDARNEDHITQCVRNGNRPAESLIPDDTPEEILDLMKRCWDPDPQQRPTFQGMHYFSMLSTADTFSLIFVVTKILLHIVCLSRPNAHCHCFFCFFAEAYDFFLPFYQKSLEQHVEKDVIDLKV